MIGKNAYKHGLENHRVDSALFSLSEKKRDYSKLGFRLINLNEKINRLRLEAIKEAISQGVAYRADKRETDEIESLKNQIKEIARVRSSIRNIVIV